MPRPQSTLVRNSGRADFAYKTPTLTQEDPGGLHKVGEAEAPLASENWQTDAYTFADAIGEIGFSLDVKANLLGECLLKAEMRKPGTDEWEETSDPRVLRVLAGLRPPQGGHGELLRAAAYHYDIAGETTLTGTPVRDELGRPAGFWWEFLSVLELKVEKNGKVIRNAWGAAQGKEEVEVDAYTARWHKPDLKYSQRATSPMKRVLPICRELILLTQVIDAIVKTRLSAGILYVPWEVSFGPRDEWENGSQASTSIDEFEAELRQHLNAPIEDRSAPSSLLPLLMRGPAVIKDKPAKDVIGIIEITRELDNLYMGMREEAIKRLAAGLDLPREVVEGKGTMRGLGGGNVAKQVSEDLLNHHIIPLGRRLCEFLTVRYLRPMLTTFEGMTTRDAEWFRITLDTSPISIETDHSLIATTGMNLGIISMPAWVKYAGLDEADIMDPEQRRDWLLERLLLAQPSTGKAVFPVMVETGYIAPIPNMEQFLADWQVGTSTPGGAQLPGADAVPSGLAERPLLIDAGDRTRATLLASADAALTQGLVIAANRLLSRLGPIDKDTTKQLRTLPKKEVISAAGEALIRSTQLTVDDLFHDSFDDLGSRVADWLAADLASRGADPYSARQRAVAAAEELTVQLASVAASAIRQRLVVGDNGFVVHDAVVTSALTAGDLVQS